MTTIYNSKHVIRTFAGMTVFLLVLSVTPARAAEFLYAPDDCEFRVDLPGEPYKSTRCEPDNPKKCDKVTSFTKTFGIAATVNVNIICKPGEKDSYERYTGDLMRMTLTAMAERRHLKDYETAVQQFEEARQAAVIGMGESGQNEEIYVAQLWIGKKSIMSVEAELIGSQVTEADDMYAEILKSIRHESWGKTEPSTGSKKDEPPAKDTESGDKEGTTAGK